MASQEWDASFDDIKVCCKRISCAAHNSGYGAFDDNIWNADHLFILTATRDQARKMKTLIEEEENWGGEVWLTEDREEIDSALGSGRREYGLVHVWWD